MADERPGELRWVGPEFDLPPPVVPVRPYVICCAPRSGSTLLCQLLHRTGKMGVPEEYLNPLHLAPTMAERLGTATPDGQIATGNYLRELAMHRTSPNGIFGIKILWSQMERWLPSPTLRAMVANGKLIWLRRRDTLGQAISLLVAQQTQVWHVGPDGGREAGPAFYDGEAIRRLLGTILSEETAWARFFEVNGVSPPVVWYEDLVEDPARVCAAVCEAVGVDAGPIQVDEIPTRPTGGALNLEWARRWIDEMRVR